MEFTDRPETQVSEAPGEGEEEQNSKEEAETLTRWEREQHDLKEKLITCNTEEWQDHPEFVGLERIGGVDLSYPKENDNTACASLVVLSYPAMEVIYEEYNMVTLDAPYKAGFLAFREVPSLAAALQKLKEKDPGMMPQVLFVDGNGILHHRGFGVACHLGILTNLPCIGVAKNLLQVDGLANNDEHKEQIRQLQDSGDMFQLTGDTGCILGTALKSSSKSSKPIYISVGHKMSLKSAVRLVHLCCKHRVPEPIRQINIILLLHYLCCCVSVLVWLSAMRLSMDGVPSAMKTFISTAFMKALAALPLSNKRKRYLSTYCDRLAVTESMPDIIGLPGGSVRDLCILG
ncbi:endonuclease V isoform X2 [Bombina bombina]|uniref:endonuclease V isoform X2 n=1 Tax=Bombina bombina TaxID=8345 RepID=UPI00235AD541|nr:endonuclease V isoform X2 [Bombina bombina]